MEADGSSRVKGFCSDRQGGQRSRLIVPHCREQLPSSKSAPNIIKSLLNVQHGDVCQLLAVRDVRVDRTSCAGCRRKFS